MELKSEFGTPAKSELRCLQCDLPGSFIFLVGPESSSQICVNCVCDNKLSEYVYIPQALSEVVTGIGYRFSHKPRITNKTWIHYLFSPSEVREMYRKKKQIALKMRKNRRR